MQICVSIWTVGFIYELCPLGSVSATDYSHNLWNFQFSPYAPEPLGPSVIGLIPNDKKCSKKCGNVQLLPKSISTWSDPEKLPSQGNPI